MSCAEDCTTLPDRPVLRFPESGVVRVPFRRGLNHVLVDAVDRDGGRHTFFLDTGASFSVITPRFLETTHAPTRGETIDAVHGVGGELGVAPARHELQDLAVGGLRIERAGAIRVDLGLDAELGFDVHGVLGYNLLSRVITVIDYGAGQVEFHESGRGPADPDHVLPFRLRSGALVELEGRVNGAGVPFLLDIGSPWTFLSGRAAESSSTALGAHRESVGGAPCRAAQPDSVCFGPLEFVRPEVHAADLPVFETVGLGNSAAAILGNDLLSGHRIALDYGAAEVRVWTPRSRVTSRS